MILFTGGGCLPQCMLGYHPTPDPPRSRQPPGSRHPSPSWSRHPPEKQTLAQGQRAAGTHPTGMHSCRAKNFLKLHKNEEDWIGYVDPPLETQVSDLYCQTWIYSQPSMYGCILSDANAFPPLYYISRCQCIPMSPMYWLYIVRRWCIATPVQQFYISRLHCIPTPSRFHICFRRQYIPTPLLYFQVSMYSHLPVTFQDIRIFPSLCYISRHQCIPTSLLYFQMLVYFCLSIIFPDLNVFPPLLYFHTLMYSHLSIIFPDIDVFKPFYYISRC